MSDDPLDDDEDFDLSATIAQIELQQKTLLPEYFELLQWNATSFAQISHRCYIVQNWDPRKTVLKVTLLSFKTHPQSGKYRHVFRVTDIDGQVKSYCDCVNGKKAKLKTTCLHIQLVTDHSDDFGDVLYNKEEPETFLICVENRSLIFSIASQSGSARHHGHKRTIVSCFRKQEWKCQACVKEKYYLFVLTSLNTENCRHIQAAQKEAESLNILTSFDSAPEEMTAVIYASGNIDQKAVSRLPISPSERC